MSMPLSAIQVLILKRPLNFGNSLYGMGDEARLHFLLHVEKIMVLMPSNRHQAIVRWTIAIDLASLIPCITIRPMQMQRSFLWSG